MIHQALWYRDLTASHDGVKAEMAVWLNWEVGQVKTSKSGLGGPPPCGEDILKGMSAALKSPRRRDAADFVGVGRKRIVVGSPNGPDDPTGNRISRWGPVTPDEAEETAARLKAAGKADIKAQTLHWAQTVVGGPGVWGQCRNVKGGWVVTRQSSLGKKARHGTKPGTVGGETEVSWVSG